MRRGSRKPYEESKRAVCLTVPNRLLDAIRADMEAQGEDNLSRHVSRILEAWAEGLVDDRPSGKVRDASDDLDGELARFEGFSSSRFIR